MKIKKWTEKDLLDNYKNCKSFNELSLKLGLSGEVKLIKKTCQNLGLDTSHFTKSKADWNKLSELIPKAISYAEVLKWLGLAPYGSNYQNLKSRIKDQNIDTSHFLGQGHSRGKKLPNTYRRMPLEEVLKENTKYGGFSKSSSSLRNKLIKENILENKCKICGITEWLGNPIQCHLDHINGIRSDARLENLRILCPNCHSQTDTYCGRNKGKHLKQNLELQDLNNLPPIYIKPEKFCSKCNKKIMDKAKSGFCRQCYATERSNIKTKILWPSNEELQILVQKYSLRKLGMILGVTDNSIRKRCIKRNIIF